MPLPVVFALLLPCLLAVAVLGLRLARVAARARRHGAVVGLSHGLAFALDADGRWTFVGERAKEILGYQRAELVGRPVLEVVAPEHRDEARELIGALCGGGTVRDRTIVLQRADGARVTLQLNAVSLGDGTVAGSAEDVTLVRDLQRRLLHTERMHAIGAMTGGIAHDFKNLLTVVIAQAQLARNGSDVERRLASILDTAERGKDMVQQLLNLAHEDSARREIIDLVATVRGMGHLLARLVPDGPRLKMELARKPVRVRADRPQIEQIVTNLVINARDASPQDGAILVSVDGGELPIKKCEELGIEPGKWAVLQVVDKGSGMTEEVLAQAFEPFYTTKGEGVGTGLGLSTVHGLVHQCGGTVKARSEPGRGTRMAILLPLVTSESAAEHAVEPRVIGRR